MDTNKKTIEIFCQQVLTDNASVFSIQWAILPLDYAAKLTPDFIMEMYFSYLKRVTLSLARPVQTANGLEFRLLSTKYHLLAFSAPECLTEDRVSSVTLRICGGPFVQGDQCNRGRFSFIAEPACDGVKVTVKLSDYYPRLLGNRSPSRFRKYLYRFTQAFVHKLLTTRFLCYLYRCMTGRKAGFSIANAHVQPGEEI